MANAEQFGRLPLPLVEQGVSFHPRALLLSGPCPPQITIIAAIGGPTAAPSVAAIVVVACSRYNESCHLAGCGRSHLSIPPSRPPPHRRCIVRLLSRRRRRRRRDLLLAFEMIMPSRPGDTETERKKERKKRVTASRAERERIS